MQLLSFDGVSRMVEESAGFAIVPESAALRYARTMAIRVVQFTDDWAFARSQCRWRRESAQIRRTSDFWFAWDAPETITVWDGFGRRRAAPG